MGSNVLGYPQDTKGGAGSHAEPGGHEQDRRANVIEQDREAGGGEGRHETGGQADQLQALAAVLRPEGGERHRASGDREDAIA